MGVLMEYIERRLMIPGYAIHLVVFGGSLPASKSGIGTPKSDVQQHAFGPRRLNRAVW